MLLFIDKNTRGVNMSGSVYGKNFMVSTWGESHGVALGACVDGCPSGVEISREYIQKFLDRRKPGQSEFTTARAEGDEVRILSGIFNGMTTGTPIAMIIENKDHKSKDYSDLEEVYRPGHADFGFSQKFKIRDHRGGGRSSGRETIGRVAAGAIASKVLEELGISVRAYSKQIGKVAIDENRFDFDEIAKNPFCMPDKVAATKAADYVRELKAQGQSVGGIIECQVRGLKPGIGQPVFDKLDASLAKAIFSIGAVKGFEIGAGFLVAGMKGSDSNDSFAPRPEGGTLKLTNNSGGSLGGMSDGDTLIFRAAIKPTPSVSVSQKTVNKSGEEVDLVIKGRHDPIIVPRAVVVVESMAAITILDLIMQDMSSRIEYLKMYYESKGK